VYLDPHPQLLVELAVEEVVQPFDRLTTFDVREMELTAR
jgi:hypothetical protein